jgi:hypothetical protein
MVTVSWAVHQVEKNIHVTGQVESAPAHQIETGELVPKRFE